MQKYALPSLHLPDFSLDQICGPSLQTLRGSFSQVLDLGKPSFAHPVARQLKWSIAIDGYRLEADKSERAEFEH